MTYHVDVTGTKRTLPGQTPATELHHREYFVTAHSREAAETVGRQLFSSGDATPTRAYVRETGAVVAA